MYSNELMLMIAKFLYGEYSAEDFSFDFPARLSYVYDEFMQENSELCNLLEDEMPEICADYDQYGLEDTYDAKEFRKRVFSVYIKALNLTEPELRKIS